MSCFEPAPSMMVVFSFSTRTRLARPSMLRVTFSSLMPRSSDTAVPPVRIAMSSSIALRRSPKPGAFTALRIAQGLCMAAAFTLTLAYLGEHCSMADAAGAFAAYVTGNVASNLFGRLLAAGLADHLGLQTTFLALAALNLAGAGLVWFG